MKRRSRTGGKDSLRPTAPLWALTFSDMMTLLLAFFIAIVSFSNIEISRYRAAMGSFRGALQSPFSAEQVPGRTPLPQLSESLYEAQEAVEAAGEVKELTKHFDMPTGVETSITPEGVRITLSNPVLFDEGKEELKPDAIRFLGGIARIIRKHDAAGVLIEGHTDDTPIHTVRFPSNWELSAARALSVLRLFQTAGVAPEKLVAVGYGEFRPKEDVGRNALPADKAVNRRVEILLQVRSESVAETMARGRTSKITGTKEGGPETGHE